MTGVAGKMSTFELKNLSTNLSLIDHVNGIEIILAEQPLRERAYTFPTAQQNQLRSMADLSLKEDLSSDIDIFFAITSPSSRFIIQRDRSKNQLFQK